MFAEVTSLITLSLEKSTTGSGLKTHVISKEEYQMFVHTLSSQCSQLLKRKTSALSVIHHQMI